MDYATLRDAVATDAAFRRRQRLQPVGGVNDKIFPPTYPGEGRSPASHVLERRRVGDQTRWCALVDSVQSQANRLEEALSAAIAEGAIGLPHLVVDFTGAGLVGLEAISSLQAPHRIYDAILRDSLLDGKPFMKSPLGLLLAEAKPASAQALLEASPTALLFGAWHSTGEGGGLGAKFPRTLVSEIAAIGVALDSAEAEASEVGSNRVPAMTGSRRTSSRIDPLGILRAVKVYQGEGRQWDVEEKKAGKKPKEVRPSEINHGNIKPSVDALGITCDYAEQVAVISFAGIRRLGFGGGARNAAAHAYLAALGLLALAEQDRRGYALRSRCDLVCEGSAPLQRVRPDGAVEEVALDRDIARRLYAEALEAARAAGFTMTAEPVRLVPQDKLVQIVAASQRLALEGEGGQDDAAEGG